MRCEFGDGVIRFRCAILWGCGRQEEGLSIRGALDLRLAGLMGMGGVLRDP